MRRITVGLVVLGLFAWGAACSNSSSATNRVHGVLVDYGHDEFATSYFGYFPRTVDAHPGDTVRFQQTWTGEPHTVTLGTLVQPLAARMAPFLKHHQPLDLRVNTGDLGLPSIFPETSTSTSNPPINQTAAQPCYIDAPPLPTGPCPKVRQPAFNGRQAFYSSGYVAYRGVKGNRFNLPLASDIAPGEYFYYCVLHGPAMGGFIDVKPKGTELRERPADFRDPDLTQATKLLRAEIKRSATPAARLPGTDIQAGGFDFNAKGGRQATPASVNEFFPKTFTTNVGQKVTWSMPNGLGHTVSFDVPRYFPTIRFGHDGTVTLNPAVALPAGGPGYPDGISDPPPEGVAVDAGIYDGSHFLSSGLPDGPMRYSVTFSKPGTYLYACTVHPDMLGKIVVTL